MRVLPCIISDWKRILERYDWVHITETELFRVSANIYICRCSFSGCKRSYTTAGNLKSHEKTHKGEYLFTCNQVPYSCCHADSCYLLLLLRRISHFLMTERIQFPYLTLHIASADGCLAGNLRKTFLKSVLRSTRN